MFLVILYITYTVYVLQKNKPFEIFKINIHSQIIGHVTYIKKAFWITSTSISRNIKTADKWIG